ncbi:unnamed protein product [Meganyctiphanes norvegica]|uniref:Uncharacterized protein n=2 Tax=Meganyctiphanes norvegica TaxID=48144 RepID=A0AAV2Q0U3_MEGNR
MEGCGSLLGTALLSMVSKFWFENQTDFSNINYNHLDFYFYFLGCIQFTVALVFSGFLYMQRFSLRPLAFPRQRNAERRRVMVDADGDGWRDRDEVRQRGLSQSIEEEDEESNGEDNDSDDGAIDDRRQLL